MTTYYVATDGNNANNGSSGTPWKTIDYAVAAARNLQPGDTIIVRPGTYNTSGVAIGASGSAAGGYITVKSETKHAAKVVSSGANGFLMTNKHHVRIEGFDVSNATTGINGSKCHHLEIVNNASHDHEAQGIYIRESDFLLIEGNTVYNCSNNNKANNSISIHFMQTESGDTTTPGFRLIIRGNHCYNNGLNTTSTDSGGIMVDSNPTSGFQPPELYTYPRLVENNLCHDNGGPGIIILESLNTTVRCNTCYHNGRKPTAGGFVGNLVNRSDNVTWLNNVGVADKANNPDSPAISCPVLASRSPQTYVNVKWYNNVSFNGVVGETSLFSNGGNSGNLPVNGVDGNQLGVNPKLVNPSGANGDYHPASNSPLIDAGTTANNGNPGIDYEGTTRVAPIDIGAFEHIAAATGSMAPNSSVSALAVLRTTTTNIVSELGLGGNFTTRVSRNTPAPASYIADTGNAVQDTFGQVTKTIPASSLGSIVAVWSMKPET